MSPFTKHFGHGFDPATLTAIGLGISALSGAAGATASLINKPKAPAPPQAAPAPPPQSQPQGSPTSGVPQQTPSFLAAAASPNQSNTTGGQGKTLLGQ
jgi:hypothetical protein